jgi:formylglycine-generating enzyme required for sulfatase activity
MKRSMISIQVMVFMALAFGIASGVDAEEPGEKIKNSVGMEFVLVKPGQFQMGSPEDEPGRFPKEGSYRVMRGGAWFSPARDVRCASRFGSPPPYRFLHIGLRLVMTP